MPFEIYEIAELVGLTSAITCAANTVVIYAFKEQVKQDLCNQMNDNFHDFRNSIEDLLIRVGILERVNNKKH